MALGMQYATAGNEFTTMSGDNYTEIVLKPFNISITAPDLQRKNVFNFVRSTGPVNPRALAIWCKVTADGREARHDIAY